MIKVTYVDHMGDDLRPVNAARISFNKSSEALSEKDTKLIGYLAEHVHLGVFEHQVMTVIVDVPIYIARQIMRHRTFAYNEVSRRYTSEELEFYLPSPDDVRVQAKNNRQASDGILPNGDTVRLAMADLHSDALRCYHRLLGQGVCREQARGVLPQSLMTKFYMTGNLRNWVHFIKLRLGEGAQPEVKVVAEGVKALLLEHWPVSTKALIGD